MATVDLSKLNDSQRAVASRLDEPLFVAAGAGSGKTFTLTARLVHALSMGSARDGGRFLESIDQALVITFTKAAALEIAERVRGALRASGKEDPHLYEESLKVDDAWISTIHGMCGRILRRHALELGLDPEFRICEGSVADALMARALDEVMSEVQRDEAYEELRREYPLWGSGADGAGGTSVVSLLGRLRAEAAKCAHGWDDLRWPESHETPDVMARLGRALDALCDLKLTQKQGEVALAARDAVADFLTLPPGLRIPSAACAALEPVKIPSLRKADQKPLADEAKELLAEAMVCVQYERVQGLVPQLVALARRVDESYARLKLERSYLDNDDLVSLALAAVEENPEVAADYAGRFRLVMIDEFQDTDEKQLRLISMLSGEGACHLTTVGDAQQSIYRFRGGDVEVFRARGRALPPESHVEMDVNYRSDPHVLAVVERSCGDAGLLDDFLKLAASGGRRGSYPAGCMTERACEGNASSAVGLPRFMLEVAAGGTSELMSATLAAQLADRLAACHAKGQPQSSMALLLGTTSEVGLYLDALRARGLKAVVTGGSSFASTTEVGVVQALLHTLANPHDTEAGLFRLLSSEMFRLDADDFCQLGTRTQEKLDAPTKRPVEQCFVDGPLKLYGDANPSARLLAAYEVLRRAFGRLGRWQLADVCQAVVDESGWLARLESQGSGGLARAANVLAAVRYVRELTVDLGLGVARAAEEFDRWLTAAKLTPKNLTGDKVDAVRVMTIHGSKGLQFGVCAVAECWGRPKVSGGLSVGRNDGVCMVCATPKTGIKNFSAIRKTLEVPESWDACGTVAEWASLLDALELEAQLAEKARLLYVALTRAEEALVVGVPVAEKEHLRSPLALGFLDAFVPVEDLEADEFGQGGFVSGEREVSIAPERPVEVECLEVGADGASHIVRKDADLDKGLVRVVRLLRGVQKGDPWRVASAGMLRGFDGELPESVTHIPVLGTDEAASTTSDHVPFVLYQAEARELQTYGWRPREGVYSYSSIQAQKRAAEAAAQRNGRPPTPTRAEQDAEAEGAAYTPDADKATALGSAFHQLAQTMVETGRLHSEGRLKALCRTWNLSERQVGRLRKAIAIWEESELRREVLGWQLVRAEVPFFAALDGGTYGSYAEGAIDLLCTRGPACEGPTLVVDYKTGDVGLGEAEVHERHAEQAGLYARVLLSLGFSSVECAFIAVETGVVARYHFEKRD